MHENREHIQSKWLLKEDIYEGIKHFDGIYLILFCDYNINRGSESDTLRLLTPAFYVTPIFWPHYTAQSHESANSVSGYVHI